MLSGLWNDDYYDVFHISFHHDCYDHNLSPDEDEPTSTKGEKKRSGGE